MAGLLIEDTYWVPSRLNDMYTHKTFECVPFMTFLNFFILIGLQNANFKLDGRIRTRKHDFQKLWLAARRPHTARLLLRNGHTGLRRRSLLGRMEGNRRAIKGWKGLLFKYICFT